MNYIASITSQGQMTIPKSLRDKYGIKKQAKAIIHDMGDGMLIKTYTDIDFWTLKGILRSHPIVKANRRKKLSQIIAEENKAFEKSVANNAVSEI